MSSTPNDRRIAFDRFSLDLVNECLWRGAEEIKIRPKAFAVLNYLLTRSGQLVTKEELLNAVWPETFVGDAVLKVTVRQLREVLDDDPKCPRFIETSHRRGYRFIAEIAKPTQLPQREQFIRDDSPSGAFLASAFSSGVFHSGAFPVYSGVVGREQALGVLQRRLRRTLRGQRQIVFVTGEAGIGKTALVDTFARTIPSDAGIRVGRGQCLEQYGTGEAYLPVLEAIGRLGRNEQQVVDIVRTHAPMWLLQMPSLLSPSDRELLSKEMSGATRERMLREMGEALDVLTAEVPLVLILEDLHWSDYSTLDLISHLATQRERAHLLLIGTYRDAELTASGHPLRVVKQELMAKQLCRELPLEYLTETAVSDYLSRTFPGNRFPAGLAGLIHNRTDGNPLFMVNAVNYLLEAGLIVFRGAIWELSVDIANVEVGVPDNIRQMIERHVDHLGLEAQRTLEAASVAGLEFSTPALAAGLEEDPRVVEARCNELARQGQYIKECGVLELPNGELVTRFGFVHALYQNVLYDRLPVGRRVKLHRLIAERGEEVYGKRAVEISTELAMHFERGRNYTRAAHYYKEGANKAIRRFAYPEAVELAHRGIKLIEKLPETRETLNEALCLHLTLGVPLIATEGYASPNVGKVYMRARELYEQLGDSPDVSEVFWGLWTFHTLSAELETARHLAERFLELAERLPYAGIKLRAHWALEITFMHLGNFELALDHFNKALALYEPEAHRDDSFLYALNPGVAMPCFASWALWILGRSDQAVTRLDEALALARELSEPQGLAHAFLFAAVIYHLRRDQLMAQQYAEAGIEISAKHGIVMYEAMATIMHGWTLSEQGRESEAVHQIRGAIAAFDATSTSLVRPHFLALLALALSKVNQNDEALQQLDEAIAMVNNKGERYYEAELYRLKGELLLNSNQTEAEQCFKKSFAVAELQKAKAWQLRTATSLARLYRSQGKNQQARDILKPVFDSFNEGLDTIDLRDAASELSSV
ncbi:MAG TPA: AAA family ATPase [Pyrinomonadaceae bacterium]|nr:AAA family ATPase [Pyrinomonadaceae bacterium]